MRIYTLSLRMRVLIENLFPRGPRRKDTRVLASAAEERTRDESVALSRDHGPLYTLSDCSSLRNVSTVQG